MPAHRAHRKAGGAGFHESILQKRVQHGNGWIGKNEGMFQTQPVAYISSETRETAPRLLSVRSGAMHVLLTFTSVKWAEPCWCLSLQNRRCSEHPLVHSQPSLMSLSSALFSLLHSFVLGDRELGDMAQSGMWLLCNHEDL